MRKASENYEKMPYEMREFNIFFSVKQCSEGVENPAEQYEQKSGKGNHLYYRIGSH